MKANIAIDCRMIYSSGIGTYIQSILPNVINQINNSNFYLIVNFKIDNFFDNINIVYIEVNAKPYSVGEQFEIRKKLPENLSLYWSPHYINPLFLNTKYLLTIHDMYHLNKTNNFWKRLYAYLYFSHIKFYNYNLIAVSNFTKNELLKFGFNSKSINMIYNGVSSKYKNLKLERKKIILSVGNLKKNKNISRLVDAFEIIQNDIDLDLYIVGEYKNIRDKDCIAINKIKLNKRIHLLGVLDQVELEKLYNYASFYIQPSTYEGFGYPPLEAMSCACPVLSSKEASLKEVCKDGALYFDAYNYKDIASKMKDFIESKSLKNRLINNGKRVILDYNLTTTINKTINLIERKIK